MNVKRELIAYTAIYAVLMVIMISLMKKFAVRSVNEIEIEDHEAVEDNILSKA